MSHSNKTRAKLMRIYIFKSETTKELRAFAGDSGGTKLPDRHAPWTATGVTADGKAPPHNLSRETIEENLILLINRRNPSWTISVLCI
jgi:hypothetical protein